ncbi:MAG: putative membrane protein [Bradymonadia bacterium]|jgi:uncharacterized membrane protein
MKIVRVHRPLVAGLASAAALTLGFSMNANAGDPSWSQPGDTIEKCAGIVLAGQNDCGANGHSCGGHAAGDNDPNEWVYMPAGICETLNGASVVGSRMIDAAAE